jgi:hypothetical protein
LATGAATSADCKAPMRIASRWLAPQAPVTARGART